MARRDRTWLVIEGGSLTEQLEVTRTRILEVSTIWSYGGDSFLDYSRDPARKSPHLQRAYEVSLYAKLERNDVKKMYVVRYYLNPGRAGIFICRATKTHGVLATRVQLSDPDAIENGITFRPHGSSWSNR